MTTYILEVYADPCTYHYVLDSDLSLEGLQTLYNLMEGTEYNEMGTQVFTVEGWLSSRRRADFAADMRHLAAHLSRTYGKEEPKEPPAPTPVREVTRPLGAALEW